MDRFYSLVGDRFLRTNDFESFLYLLHLMVNPSRYPSESLEFLRTVLLCLSTNVGDMLVRSFDKVIQLRRKLAALSHDPTSVCGDSLYIRGEDSRFALCNIMSIDANLHEIGSYLICRTSGLSHPHSAVQQL